MPSPDVYLNPREYLGRNCPLYFTKLTRVEDIVIRNGNNIEMPLGYVAPEGRQRKREVTVLSRLHCVNMEVDLLHRLPQCAMCSLNATTKSSPGVVQQGQDRGGAGLVAVLLFT